MNSTDFSLLTYENEIEPILRSTIPLADKAKAIADALPAIKDQGFEADKMRDKLALIYKSKEGQLPGKGRSLQSFLGNKSGRPERKLAEGTLNAQKKQSAAVYKDLKTLMAQRDIHLYASLDENRTIEGFTLDQHKFRDRSGSFYQDRNKDLAWVGSLSGAIHKLFPEEQLHVPFQALEKRISDTANQQLSTVHDENIRGSSKSIRTVAYNNYRIAAIEVRALLATTLALQNATDLSEDQKTELKIQLKAAGTVNNAAKTWMHSFLDQNRYPVPDPFNTTDTKAAINQIYYSGLLMTQLASEAASQTDTTELGKALSELNVYVSSATRNLQTASNAITQAAAQDDKAFFDEHYGEKAWTTEEFADRHRGAKGSLVRLNPATNDLFQEAPGGSEGSRQRVVKIPESVHKLSRKAAQEFFELYKGTPAPIPGTSRSASVQVGSSRQSTRPWSRGG